MYEAAYLKKKEKTAFECVKIHKFKKGKLTNKFLSTTVYLTLKFLLMH